MDISKQPLTQKWKKVYKKISDHELLVEADFESLCIGWCIANGLSVDDAYSFYQSMISLGYF